MSGPAGSHRGQLPTAPPRGPSAEPRRRRGRETGEGRNRTKEKKRAKWISMASYNIRDGRNGGLQLAARALDRSMGDITVVQEVKIKDAKYATRKWEGYELLTASVGTANCGGVALLVRENNDWAFTIEIKKAVGPNVISCEIVTGPWKRWLVVGYHLPQSDKEGVAQRMVIDAA